MDESVFQRHTIELIVFLVRSIQINENPKINLYHISGFSPIENLNKNV